MLGELVVMSNIILLLIRKIITVTGISRTRAYIKYYRMRRGSENISHLLEKERADRFAKIYKTGVWLNERNSGALSGFGSEVANTGEIRRELPKIIIQLGVKSLLDVGCGDWNWMRHIELPCEYIGVDIVTSVIDRNIVKFGGSGRSFMVLDAVAGPLPDCDAILLREVVFHLSFSDARSLIRNILQTRARYLFVTSDSDTNVNTDIRTGDFRDLNLKIKPFCFPETFIDIPDDGVRETRRIGVWKLDDLRLSGVMK